MSRSFAERLKLLRGKTSREVFSDKVGISPRSLANYEQGLREPKGKIAAQISARLGVSLAWLLTGEGSMYQQEGSGTELSPKTCDMLQVSTDKKTQLIENTALEKNQTCDMSQVLALQRDLLEAVRQNGDLRVEVERQRARIADLERQLAETPVQAPDEALARLERDNRNLREEVCRLKRGRMADPPETDEMQARI